MKQIEYKNVIVRPRTITFEEYQAEQVEKYKTNDAEYVKKYLATEYLYWDRQTHWFVFFENGRIVRIPKKKYTEDNTTFYARLDKVIGKVERESTTDLGKFAAMMQKLINDKIRRNTYIIYPTTYGIGLWAIYNFKFERDRTLIESVLGEIGVDYTNEFSDAAWAYRFKISKSAANRALIAANIV